MADRKPPLRKTSTEILQDLAQPFRAYAACIRFPELGIGIALDDGGFDQALALCDQAVAPGLGAAYAAKRASIERMG